MIPIERIPIHKCGKTIKQLRLQLSMLQRELAKEIQISPMAISQYERGIRMPRMGIIRKIIAFATLHNIHLSWSDFMDL